MSNFRCSMCYFSSSDQTRWLNHIIRWHKHDSNFIVFCSVGDCAYSSRSWGAFRVHVCRKHKFEATLRDRVEDVENDIDFQACHEFNENELRDPKEQNLMHNAAFTLSLEAQHKLSQKAIDDVVKSAANLICDHISVFKEKVKEKLVASNIPNDFLDAIPTEYLLEQFDSSYKRSVFYEKNLSMVKPHVVKLNSTIVTANGRLTRKERYGYIIPFKESLASFLQMPEVQHFVNHSHQSTNDIMHDICDGDYLRNNPLFQRNRNALQVILNTDDIEIVNPIGSHTKKHKLSMFYYTLGNIPPEYRSRLHAIQLLAVAYTKDVRAAGPGVLLADFVANVNSMASGGIYLNIKGTNVLYEGTLVIAPCDTPAAHWLGGFKEGVGFAFKSCRCCSATKAECKALFVEKQFNLRCENEHRERCTNLELMSNAARNYWSKMWGINDTSCLMGISSFPICSGLVQDPMHLFLEGLVPYELKCMLYSFTVTNKYFTLDWLNSKIAQFPYTYLESNSKPVSIERSCFNEGGKIKQTASAMMTLCCILPFIVSKKVPENEAKWINFLRLVQMTFLGTTPFCTKTTAGMLAQLIFDHHTGFKLAYPGASITPKMHYCVHLPKQMTDYGPPRNHWCMRFEAKHNYIKSQKWKCFKNLPKSISSRHQTYMCYKQMGALGNLSESFLYGGDIVKEGDEINLPEVYPEQVDMFCEVTNCTCDGDMLQVYQTSSVTILGHEYRCGCCLVLSYEEDVPNFGILKDILIKNDKKVFVVDQMITVGFEKHALCYQLSSANNICLVPHSSLFSKWPLSIVHYNGLQSVINRYSHLCEPL